MTYVRTMAGRKKSLDVPRRYTRYFFPGLEGLLVLVMGYQGIGKQGDDFIEQIQGKDVPRKGYPLRPEYGHAETDIVPCLGMLFQGSHIADIVARGENPEKGRDEGENHAQSIRAETHLDPRQNREQGVRVNMSFQDARRHGHHGQKGHGGQDKGNRLPPVLISGKKPNQKRRRKGNRHGKKRTYTFYDLRFHGHEFIPAVGKHPRLRTFKAFEYHENNGQDQGRFRCRQSHDKEDAQLTDNGVSLGELCRAATMESPAPFIISSRDISIPTRVLRHIRPKTPTARRNRATS